MLIDDRACISSPVMMISFQARNALLAMLERYEGVRLKPYVDTEGKIPIGVGRNLTDGGISSAESDGMLPAQSRSVFTSNPTRTL